MSDKSSTATFPWFLLGLIYLLVYWFAPLPNEGAFKVLAVISYVIIGINILCIVVGIGIAIWIRKD